MCKFGMVRFIRTVFFISACQNQFIPLQSMIRNKELLRSNYPANLSAQPSIHPDGTDLQSKFRSQSSGFVFIIWISFLKIGNDNATIRFFYNLGHEYMRYMHYRFPSKAVNAMFQGILTDSFPTRPNRYSGGFYDNFHDIGELANDFGRSVSIPAGRDQHTVSIFVAVYRKFRKKSFVFFRFSE